MVKYSEEHLDLVFSALGDRTRRAILGRLAEAPGTVTALAEPFEMSLPAVSKHLRVLVDARLIQKERDGRLHRCSLEPGSLRPANDWIQHYRRFWEESFDSLEEYLDGMGQGQGQGQGRGRGRSDDAGSSGGD